MQDTTAGVAGVLVAYNTRGDVLMRTIERVAPQVDQLLVWDNSDKSSYLRDLVVNSSISNVEYHSSQLNVGIAEAQNRAILRSIELGAKFVLFLDDDSSFPDGGVCGLLSELETERMHYPETVGIGPLITDSRTGEALAIVWDGRFLRTGIVSHRTEVAFLLSSGALIDIQAFQTFGLFRSEYFIDHVDKEWGLRVGLQGGRLVVTNKVKMLHQLGDEPTFSRRGTIRYRHESPVRDYYLTRNAIFLMRDLRLSPMKYLDLIKLLAVTSVREIIGLDRTIEQRTAVAKGLLHGTLNLRGKRGP